MLLLFLISSIFWINSNDKNQLAIVNDIENTKDTSQLGNNIYKKFPNQTGILKINKSNFCPEEIIVIKYFQLKNEKDSLRFLIKDSAGKEVINEKLEKKNNLHFVELMLPNDINDGKYNLEIVNKYGNVLDMKAFQIVANNYFTGSFMGSFTKEVYEKNDLITFEYQLKNIAEGQKNIKYTLKTDKEHIISGESITYSNKGKIKLKTNDKLDNTTVLEIHRENKPSLLFKLPTKNENLVLKLYPENGEMIKGLPNRIAFTAKNEQNENVEIEGILINRYGETETKLCTDHKGVGVFEWIPNDNEYYIMITKPWGYNKIYKIEKIIEGGTIMISDTIFG